MKQQCKDHVSFWTNVTDRDGEQTWAAVNYRCQRLEGHRKRHKAIVGPKGCVEIRWGTT